METEWTDGPLPWHPDLHTPSVHPRGIVRYRSTRSLPYGNEIHGTEASQPASASRNPPTLLEDQDFEPLRTRPARPVPVPKLRSGQ
jgi:hypothetical protein